MTLEKIPPSPVTLDRLHGDYFQVLGLERRLQLDEADLERRYHDLSRRSHPDFFRAAPPAVRIVALENSALVNQAYRTLRDPVSRVEYLIRLELGDGTREAAPVPEALFEQALELQDLLLEYEAGDEGARAAIRPRLEDPRRELQQHFDQLDDGLTSDLFPSWDAADKDERERLLSQMQGMIGDRSYLRRMLMNLERALEVESAG